MLIFKGSQVIKYYVMFAFLFVQTVETNERIKLETSIHTFRKYKGTVRSICILHPMLRESQSVPGGKETLPAAQTT